MTNPLKSDPANPHYVGPQLHAGHKLNPANATDKAAFDKMIALMQEGVLEYTVLAVADEGPKERIIVLKESYLG